MTARFLVQVIDNNTPMLGRYITITQGIVDEIERGDRDRCVGLMKAIVSTYKKIESKEFDFIRLFNGHKFYLNLNPNNSDKALEEIQKDFMLHGEYEPYTTKLIERIVKEGDIAVDVGASIGYFTLLLAKQVGKTGKVFSIEPTKNQFDYLLKNIEINGYRDRIISENIAAWDKDEIAEIQCNAGNPKKLQGIPIDNIIKEPINFIKIDTDGSEPHVLKGLIETIERSPKLKMVIEYYPKYIENLGGNPQEVMDILNKYFTLEKIEGDYGGEYWNYYCVRK